MNKQQYLKDVREQYENYPYPYREPSDENKRLLRTYEDQISLINHYGFKGNIPLSKKGKEFRVLIAGGGTGDAAIHLAFQLQGFNAKVIYLDITQASMNIAKQRAQVRNLDNIEFIHGSILDLSAMGLEPFHYINSSGVLHHLASPTDGLNALKSVLRDDGVMGIMVYGKYGRTGIYQMQELMRMVNQDEENLQTKVDNTKKMLNILPDTNWFKRDEKRFRIDIEEFGDIGIYDLFLHSQDRCYDVKELYHWVEDECSLKIVEFMGPLLTGKLGYMPELLIKDKSLQEKVAKLPKIEKQAIAENILGSLIKHTFYVSKQDDTIASVDDLDLIPFFLNEKNYNIFLSSKMQEHMGKAITLNTNGVKVNINSTKSLTAIIKNIDGTKSLKEIYNSIDEDNTKLHQEFKPLYSALFMASKILLKGKKCSQALNEIFENVDKEEDKLNELKAKQPTTQTQQKVYLSTPSK